MKIVAVSVGRVGPLWSSTNGDRPVVLSAIAKQPISRIEDRRPVQVNLMGLDGDEQADLSVHGGRDKAIYAYPVEHYPVWRTIRMQALKIDEALEYGSMGENLSVLGLTENQVWIGDLLKIAGDSPNPVILRVSAPRSPCFKFNARMGFKHAAKMMVQSGYTGFYLQVVKPGVIRAGDSFDLIPGARIMRVDEQHRFNSGASQKQMI